MDIPQIDNDDRDTIARTDAMIQELIQKWHAAQGKTPAIHAAGALFVRMAGSWRSICVLLESCKDQHESELVSNDAAAILRCLHDASLQAEYILAGDTRRGLTPDDLGRSYLDFEIVERHRMMTKGLTYPSVFARRLAMSPRRPEGEAKLQKEFDQVKDAYRVGTSSRIRPHWYKGNLNQIAKVLGRGEEHFWFLRSFDSSIHAGPLAVLRGPAPAGADLMIPANHLLCRTAKSLVSAANLVLLGVSAEVLDAGEKDLLNVAVITSSEPATSESNATQRLTLSILNLPGVGRKSARDILTAVRLVPESLTPAEFTALLQEYGGPRTRNLVEQDGAAALDLADRTLDAAASADIAVLSILDADFPEQLRAIPNPPAVIFVRGNRDAVARMDCVAVIGTRDPTSFGSNAAHRVAMRCAEAGVVVVSGLALGCDARAHRGCLDGAGVTVAVLAHGADQVYPVKNRALADQILEGNGALVSEYPIGEKPQKNYFVERDRLQSGFCRAVIVIETDVKGGTMHTVRFAREQGRIVACLVHPEEFQCEPKTQGNQKLIRDGTATPIGSAAQLVGIIERVRTGDGATDRSVDESLSDSRGLQLDLWGGTDRDGPN